jgi:CzcA family heavy metal efflux pump
MSLFEFFQRHAKAILFTIGVLAVSGIAMMVNLPVSLFPDITFPRIVILADDGEEPTERMMVEVTRPLEEVATAIPGVQFVRSKTSRGSTEISIGLDWKSDVQQTLMLLQGRIANIRNDLPPAASIQAEQMTVAVFPISGYSLTSDSLSLVQLRDIALYQIRPALLRVNGVARVQVLGGDTREFLVRVNPEKLAAYRLTIRQVTEAVTKTNFIQSTGLLDNNYQMYLALVSGLLKTTDDIASVVIDVRNHTPIRVGDVATVTPAVQDKFIRTTAHGSDAVLITILKQPTGSTVQIGQDIATVIGNLSIPKAVHFENFYDQGDFIHSSIRGVRDSILIGIGLAMVILFVFLRSWRLTFVILLVVPATIAATFVCLGVVGKTINIMTLGGIAAAVGLIIDDSIVIVEYIFAQFARHRHAGSGRAAFAASARTSLRELMPAIIGSTASTIVIHIPLAFLGGVTGAFFASLSVTMVFAMLISFLFSISLAPLLASLILSDRDIEIEVERETVRSAFSRWTERTVNRIIRQRIFVLPFIVLAGIGIYTLYQNLGSSFMPEMDEGAFVLDYIALPGTSLNETNRMLMHVEDILRSIPEVDSYSRRTGAELGFFLTEPNTGDYVVKLKKDRHRGIEDVISEVRGRVQETEPSIQIDFGQLMMDVIGDLTNNPSPIEIKLFGDDQPLLHSTAKQVKKLIESVPGVVDTFDGIVIAGPSFVVHVDATKAALAGFMAEDVLAQIRNMMQGEAESKIQKGEKLIGIRVRYPEAYRTDLEKIQQMNLINARGDQVPLRTIATLERTTGQAEIHREQLKQLVAVKARISGRDLGSTVTEIKKKLASTIQLPSGMTVEYGGIYQTQQESFRGLLLVSLAAFLLVAIVLLFEFGEFAIPVSIFIINILSLAGVFGALWITNVTLNISSFVGIVMIIGIVAENAIFVMHMVKTYLKEGVPIDQALTKAVVIRIRPIIMTTLAAVLALLPLSLGLGAGAQMQKPLAIVVIGGFSVSSLLLFFVLPPLYRLLYRN